MNDQTQRTVNERINLHSDITLYKLAEETAAKWYADLPWSIQRTPKFYLDGLWQSAINPDTGQDQVALFIRNRRNQGASRQHQQKYLEDFNFYKLREDMSQMDFLHNRSHGIGGYKFLELLQFTELLPQVCEGLDLTDEEREIVRLRLQKEFMQHFIAELNLLMAKGYDRNIKGRMARR